MLSDDEHAAAHALVARVGVSSGIVLEPLHLGRNNRTHRVDADGRSFVLKTYFRHPGDPRDRFAAEVSFVDFAWSQGVHTVPRLWAADRERGAALFEFLPGRKVEPGEVDADMVDQAVAFWEALNAGRGTPAARALPLASEPCFSLADHLALVGRRVDRLRAIDGTSPIDRAAADFVRARLSPHWARLAESLPERARALRCPMDEALAPEERCLSPSDFGYHNALRGPDGRLRFFDFEYAGWDDPARTVCDFFCQVAVPVPGVHFGRVADRVASALPRPDLHRHRAELLLPVYGVKWCCIILNEFLPQGRDRRAFAGHGAADDRKAQQFAKAWQALDRAMAAA